LPIEGEKKSMKRFSLPPPVASTKKKRKSLPGGEQTGSEIAKRFILAPEHHIDSTDKSATESDSTQHSSPAYSVERAQASETLIWQHDQELGALPLHSLILTIKNVLESDTGRMFALCDSEGEDGEYKALFLFENVPLCSRELTLGKAVKVWDPITSNCDPHLIVCSRFLLVD
jgi:hypothetical protein